MKAKRFAVLVASSFLLAACGDVAVEEDDAFASGVLTVAAP